MDKKLPEKFTSFVRGYEGPEIIDDLSLTPDQQAAQKADYFFNGRTIIAEQKSLEIDTAHKIEAILKPYEGTPDGLYSMASSNYTRSSIFYQTLKK